MQSVRSYDNLELLIGCCFTAIALVFPVLVLSSLAPAFDFMLTRFWIFGHLILLGSVFFRAANGRVADLMVVAITAMTYAMVERLALFIPEISTQMTSLGWSEASRYYYASLFFSKTTYGSVVPTPHFASFQIFTPVIAVCNTRIASLVSSGVAGFFMDSTSADR